MNIIINLFYNGSFFKGTQSQFNIFSIEDFLIFSLFKFNKKIYFLNFSSRTDKYVNCLNQLINFNFKNNFLKKVIFIKINLSLNKAINIFWIKQVSKNFHSRYSCLNRVYLFIINFFKYNLFIYFNFFIFYRKLNLYHILLLIKYILGFNNYYFFSSIFNKKNYYYYRIIYEINFLKINKFFYIIIKGNSFLYNMVLNILNILFYNIIYKYKIIFLINLFYLKKKKQKIFILNPNALFLIKVNYINLYNNFKN